MLRQARDQIESHADVQSGKRLTRKVVDARLFGELHGAQSGVSWMLKQVQYDGSIH